MKDKLIAAGIHLAISVAVAASLLVLLFVIWFPSPLMGLGAVEGVQLILLVDLAIGPLLTLIVFKKDKASLVLDLSVIAALQLSALGYGLIQIYGQTPAHLVSTYNGLHIVTRYEVENYMNARDFHVSEELSTDPVKYQGRIPVYKLDQPTEAAERFTSQSTFQTAAGLPFYMDSKSYEAFEGLDYLINAGRGSLNTDQEQECLEIPITSGHGQVMTCLYLDDRSLRLEKTLQQEEGST